MSISTENGAAPSQYANINWDRQLLWVETPKLLYRRFALVVGDTDNGQLYDRLILLESHLYFHFDYYYCFTETLGHLDPKFA